MLCLAPAARADDPVRELAHSRLWLRLLHYHRDFPFWRFKSEADGPGFFLAPQGKTDPETELRADLAAFADPARRVGKLGLQPQCAFPARYAFLKEALKLGISGIPGIPGIKDEPCPELDEFLRQINAHSATLVFSSALPGSPGSMFGHTFLRLNAKREPGSAPVKLLDYGLNFSAAIPEREISFSYAYLGVTGGYQGHFSFEPYYLKVREYIDSESRDLWEYDLALDEAQTDLLLRHAWEIEANSWFNYYFGTENCSYQLMALLEVARPDWDLTEHFVHVIPATTVKSLLATPGAVTGVRFRPSMRKRVLASYEALDSSQKTQFEEMLAGARDASTVGDPAPLDAAIEYVHYRKEQGAGALSDDEQKLLRRALLRRSRLGAAPSDALTPVTQSLSSENRPLENTRPELGHDPYRVGLSGGLMAVSSANSATGFMDLNLKVAYHDLMNDDRGYSPYSEINFPNLTLRYRPAGNRLSIEQLEFVSVTSLSPLTLLDRKSSWHAGVDYYSAKDFGCVDCQLLRGEGAIGETLSALSSHLIVYGLLYGYVEGGQGLSDGVRGGPKLELATIVNPVAPFKSRFSAMAVTDLFQPDRAWVFARLSWDQSFSLSRSWELRSTAALLLHPNASSADNYAEAKLTVNRYF